MYVEAERQMAIVSLVKKQTYCFDSYNYRGVSFLNKLNHVAHLSWCLELEPPSSNEDM